MPHGWGTLGPAVISEDEGEQDAKPWHLRALRLTTPPHGLTGKNVRVAVLDSGIARLDALPVSQFLDAKGKEIAPGDVSGHGTRCASLIASSATKAPGIARDVELVSIRVVDQQGRVWARDLLSGIEVARKLDADVISCSIVVPEVSDEVEVCVREAVFEGRVVVASAGNHPNARNAFPERIPHVTTIAALRENRSPMPGRAGPFVDIAAPGNKLRVLTERGNVTDTFGDSSAATAVVSGCCALAISAARRGPKRKRLGSTLEGLIRNSATRLPHPTDRVGFGMINPLALTKKAIDLIR